MSKVSHIMQRNQDQLLWNTLQLMKVSMKDPRFLLFHFTPKYSLLPFQVWKRAYISLWPHRQEWESLLDWPDWQEAGDVVWMVKRRACHLHQLERRGTQWLQWRRLHWIFQTLSKLVVKNMTYGCGEANSKKLFIICHCMYMYVVDYVNHWQFGYLLTKSNYQVAHCFL